MPLHPRSYLIGGNYGNYGDTCNNAILNGDDHQWNSAKATCTQYPPLQVN
ncbi:hypothetical protein FIBSPDRAFT_970380 [Athelia psychrophila]|uniref:Uncharacterized protein n=1 Tax=Athelia psychrophila TaxID=1759441 RepID=A0A167SQT7_9AGAM|nr:hypothetical protein FIBSPDRAFT_970380 [Fibularhizoctonia sp. CBS 109695]